MNIQKTGRTSLAVSLAEALAALLLLSAGGQAADEKKPAAPAKPAAKPAAPAAKGATPGAPAAGAARGATPGAPAARGGAPAAGAARGGTPAAGGARGGEAARGGATGGARGGEAARGGGAARGGEAGGRGGSVNAGRGGGHGPVASNARVEHTRGGAEVVRRSDGRPANVHTANGMDIHHGLNGHTAVMHEGPDHSRVFAERGGRGYVQHPYAFRGHEYGARTYYVNGRPYERFYRGYPYRGAYLEVYAPMAYYPVGFYGWAYNPWVAPIPYAWGFAAAPWYGVYGAYFTPYPVYANASLWLTDYLISQSLAAAYQAQAAAQAQVAALPQGQPALTPDVKQMVADEVRRQIALENAEAQQNAQNADPDPASSGIARMLADNTSHVFVVGGDLDVLDAASGQECAVSQGDVLQLATPPPPSATAATLVVMGSKGGVECRKGAAVSVELADLQNMQNHMRETLDAGLADLQSHKNGLPAPPQSAMAMATPAAFSMGAPGPDPNAAAQINQQFQEGTQAEQQALSDGGTAAPAPIAAPQAPPFSLSVGMTTDQVVGGMGQPKQIVDLGTKKIYVYQDLKVTFNNGKVTDVE